MRYAQHVFRYVSAYRCDLFLIPESCHLSLQFTYCSVCCEPFHEFCLEEKDRPKVPQSKDWLCRKCRFCQVCGKLENLLTCDRCSKTYHPECLGDGYVIKPTASGTWVNRASNATLSFMLHGLVCGIADMFLCIVKVCNSCVKCTSCGATSPGGPGDTWNSDFSLCANCEKLRLKGQYEIPLSHPATQIGWDVFAIGR